MPLGSVLSEVIDRMGLKAGMDKARVIDAWNRISGPRIAAVTSNAWLDGNRLQVQITSAPWRTELYLRRTEWLERLNKEIGTDLVREIVFR